MSKIVYVSLDIEATGPIPGMYSMISLGAAAFTLRDGIISTFSVNLSEYPGAIESASTMEFWAKNPEAYAAATKDPVLPAVAMQRFRGWLCQQPGKVVAVAYPATFDFMFVYWYFMALLGECPFGFQALDIKTLAMAAMKKANFRSVVKRAMPKEWFEGAPRHDHLAVNDAVGQAVLCMSIFKALGIADND